MLKPLVLLVDDDPAVLESLEAALRPAFESICRIEGYASAAEVLEAVPRWREEKRPIAVAIVDQKMPGMTGVELLTRLRADAGADPQHPVAHMRAILLTGYAGLDSAIAAKNEAGVDRYLEKPWEVSVLGEAVRGAFRHYLSASGRDLHFVFREVGTVDELRAHLRTRYEVYRATESIRRVVPGHESGLHVDEFDPRSTFLSLFVRDSRGDRTIGTMRVTGDRVSPVAAELGAVVNRWPDLRQRIESAAGCELPLLGYLVDRAAVACLVADIRARGEKVVEPGRFALDPRHRSGAGGGGAALLAMQMIEGAVSFFFFFFFCIEHAVLTCMPPHVRFYRPLGFRDIPGTSPKYQPEVDVELACLHGCQEFVPEALFTRIRERTERIRKRGALCQCPSFPACLGGPYGTGRFDGADLFCPSLATESLRPGEA